MKYNNQIIKLYLSAFTNQKFIKAWNRQKGAPLFRGTFLQTKNT